MIEDRRIPLNRERQMFSLKEATGVDENVLRHPPHWTCEEGSGGTSNLGQHLCIELQSLDILGRRGDVLLFQLLDP